MTAAETAPIDTVRWVKDLMDATENHEQWLATVRFGLGTLLKNQELLMTIIVTEAQREEARYGPQAPHGYVSTILDELNLKFVVNTEGEKWKTQI